MFDQIVQSSMHYGQWGLFFIAFLDSFILPVPPFFLQIALSVVAPANALYYATIAFLGSVLGAPIGYVLGKTLGKPILHKILPPRWLDAATLQFEKNGDAAVLIGAFTPIPFKVFTIFTGVFGYPLYKLMIWTVIGRGLKFFLIGVAFHYFGKRAKVMLEEYMDTTMLGMAIAVALGWFLWSLWKKKRS